MHSKGQRRTDHAIKSGECGRKARYTTRVDAAGAVFLLTADGKAKGEQRPYRCPHCGAWHVGRK